MQGGAKGLPLHDVQARKASAGGCPYLSASARSRAAFRDTLLAAPMDIEALAAHGAKRSLCAYYGARAALPEADLVLLPYGALLTEVPLIALVNPACDGIRSPPHCISGMRGSMRPGEVL